MLFVYQNVRFAWTLSDKSVFNVFYVMVMYCKQVASLNLENISYYPVLVCMESKWIMTDTWTCHTLVS